MPDPQTQDPPVKKTPKEASSKDDVMNLLSGGQGQQQPEAKHEAPKKATPTKEVNSKEDTLDLLSGTVKKKDTESGSANGSLPSESLSPSDTVDPDLKGLTQEGIKVWNEASRGPKMSELYNQTYSIINEGIPPSPDTKINGQRQQLLSGVKSGDQGAITQAKNFIKTGLQKQIDKIKAEAISAAGTSGATYFNPSPEQRQAIDALEKKKQQVDQTLNEYAVNAAANSKETQTQVRAEVSGTERGNMPNIAAEDLGKQVEKIYGGLPNPNGNIQYERQKTGFEKLIANKQMKINDLLQGGIKTKNESLLKQAEKEKAEIKTLQGRADNLIDQFPDVAVTQVSRMIGDEIAENSPRQGIITKGAVEESAKRIEAKYPGFLAKYGKFINVVEDKPGLVPVGDLVGLGGLRAGIYDIQYGAASFVAGLVGDTDTQEFADKMKESPALKGTKPTHATPTNVIYDDKGKAFKEKPDEDYGKINWNSSMRFIGQSIPGLTEWMVTEEATGGVAGLAGAGKAAKATLGLVGASYITSYDANHKIAESLIDDNSTLGQAKKAAIANLFTLTTAGAFKLVGYSPTKFVENAVTKAIAPDVLEALEENGWKQLPKNKLQDLMVSKIIPKVKTFAVETAKSIGEGGKVAGAQLADTKVKEFVSSVINPEKANATTIDENIKSFAQQALFMGLLGLPKSIVSGFDSPSTKDAFYEIGSRAPQYIERVNDGIKNGDYTQEHGNKMIATAKTLQEEVDKVQSETNKDGLPLTVGQKRDIAIQNFRKRAANGLEESGVPVSTEKVNHDADEQIKNTKSENTHLPLEETEAFKTAVEVDKEGNEIGKPKSVEDIEDSKKYKYSKNGKETTTSGLQLLSHLPNSNEYEEPEIKNADNAKAEAEKTKDAESKIPESQQSEKIDAAKKELDKAVKEGTAGIYGTLLKSEPEHAEGILREIAQQGHGIDAAGNPLEGGPAENSLPPELVQAAKEAFPKESILSPKTDTNVKDKSSDESSQALEAGSKEKTQSEGLGEGQTNPQRDVKNKEGAGEQPSPSKQKHINETLQKIKKYNESVQGESKRALLNEIRLSLPKGHTIKYAKGVIDGLYNEKGNQVQTRSEETNRTEKSFDKSGYHQDVHDIINGAVVDPVYANGLVVKDADGRNMSDKQLKSALKDIREGKDTVGAKSVYDAIAGMHENGMVDLKSPSGEQVGIPFKEYMDAFKEPLRSITDEEIAALHGEIGEDEFTKLFNDTLNENENEQSTGASEKTEQPSSGQAGKSTESTGQSKSSTEISNESQPQQAAATLRESAQRLADEGDREGAMALFQQADRIESGKPPPPEIGETDTGRPKEEKPAVSITNAAVNTDRLNVGLRPVLKEAVRKFGQIWDDARNRVLTGTTDPRSYVADLFSDIKNVPSRTFGEIDNAIVLMDRIDLTNQKQKALTDLDKARKTGNDNVEALAWQQLSEIEQKIQQNDLVADKIGTAQGRALSSRRLLAYADYSLASMKRDVAKYYPNKEIPKDVQARLEKIEAEHAEALKKLGEYEQKWKDQQAAAEFKKQNEKVTYKSKLNKEQSKIVADKLRAFAEKFEKFGRADLPEGTERQGLDIQKNIADAIRYIADKIETGDIPELIAAAIKKFGGTGVDEKGLRDKIKEGLMDAGLDEKLIDSKTQKEKQISKISELAKNSNASTITKEMITPLRRLINDYARNGETDFGKVLDRVHADLKDHFTDLTKEDVRDAYSGYGDVRLDSKTELSKKVAEWKKEATLLGQIGDVLKGEIPLRREGGKKTKASEKIEVMRKNLENKMKAAGIEWNNAPSTPQEKNARALTSLKTRLQKEIENLTNAIENKKALPERKGIELDDEAKALMNHRDALKEVLNHILGKEARKTLTDEQRVARAEKYLTTQSEKLSKEIEDIKAGTYKEGEPGKTPQSTTIDLMRGRRDALNELKRKLLTDTSPESSESNIALERYKDLIRNKLLDYQRRIEEGDFEDKENKKSFTNDAEAHRLELQQKRAETAFKQEKVNAEKKNRTKLQKIYDRINQWKRFSVLTGIPTIGKLGSAVAYRTVFNPIEELTGTILKYTVPGVYQLSKLAPREGGSISFKAESSALSQWARAETYKDAMDVIKRGQSELDERFGKYVSVPPEALEVMGRIHGAMKNFAKRQEFARSYEKRMQHAIEHGGDPADELTQLTAQSQAYIDANRNIFMQDNWLVNKFNELVGDAERSGKFGPETAAAITRFLLPIVKIPTNFVAESATYSFGSLRTIEVFTRALTGHLNDMTPEQADSLMRSIKKGTLGAAAMAIGFAMPGIAGGYYVKNGKKPEPGGLEWGELEIAGVRIPRWATHFPLFEAMQLGSTMRQVMQKDIDDGKTNEKALTDGIIKSGRGLIDEVPLFNSPQEIAEGAESGDFMNKFVYPELRSNIPIALQFTAAQLDKDENAPTVNYFGIPTQASVKRTPEGFTEQMEYGIPGLRPNVPTTEEAKQRKKDEAEQRKAAAEAQ